MKRTLTLISWIITLGFIAVVMAIPLLAVHSYTGWYGIALLLAGCLVVGIIWIAICVVIESVFNDTFKNIWK